MHCAPQQVQTITSTWKAKIFYRGYSTHLCNGIIRRTSSLQALHTTDPNTDMCLLKQIQHQQIGMHYSLIRYTAFNFTSKELKQK